MPINEITCKSVLSKSNIPGCTYAINPYTGCLHNCSYCYARFMKTYSGHEEEWGKFLDVKSNAPEVLAKEMEKNPPMGNIFLSSVTDCYQPAERKYKITRKIMDILSNYDYPITVLTKSKLAVRDLDIFKKIKNFEIGFSICTAKDEYARLVDKGASSIDERVEALTYLHENNIKTYVFVSPIIPYVTNLEEIFEMVAGKVDYIMGEMINIKCDNWESLIESVKDIIPVDEQKFRNMIESSAMWDKAESKFKELCEKYKIEFKGFFRH